MIDETVSSLSNKEWPTRWIENQTTEKLFSSSKSPAEHVKVP